MNKSPYRMNAYDPKKLPRLKARIRGFFASNCDSDRDGVASNNLWVSFRKEQSSR